MHLRATVGAITLTRITDGTVWIHWEVCQRVVGILGSDFEVFLPTPATLATAWAQDYWELGPLLHYLMG